MKNAACMKEDRQSPLTFRHEQGRRPTSDRIETAGQAASGPSPSETSPRWKHPIPAPETSTHSPGLGAVALPISQPNLCSRSSLGVEASARGPAESSPCAPEISALAVQPRSIGASSALDRKRSEAGLSLPHGSEKPKIGACNLPGNRSKDVMSEVGTVTLIRGMRQIDTEKFFQRLFNALIGFSLQAKPRLFTRRAREHSLQERHSAFADAKQMRNKSLIGFGNSVPNI